MTVNLLKAESAYRSRAIWIFYFCFAVLMLLEVGTEAQSTHALAANCSYASPHGVPFSRMYGASRLLPCATPQFLLPNKFATGDSPVRIVSADFNLDGKADVALNNRTPDRLAVLLGDGSGGLSAQLDSPFIGNITGMEVADFNNDGKPDVVATNFFLTNNVAVLLGLGNGNMDAPKLSTIPGSAVSLAIADFNNDNKVDLIVGGGGEGSVTLLLGLGTGFFSAPQVFTNLDMNLNPNSIVTADFNNDGSMDFATSGAFSGSVWVFPGTGTGSFNAPINSPNLRDLGILAGGDFNEDGKTDLATIEPTGGFNNNDNVRVMMGIGDGTFLPQIPFTVNYLARHFFVRDLNGDNHLDIATGSADSGDIALILGNGAGGFAPALHFALVNPVGFAAADFNSDGRADLATASVDGVTSVNNVAMLLGKAEGIFRAPRNYAVGINPVYLVSGYVNNDTYPDLISVSSGAGLVVTQGSISVFLGRSDGYFDSPSDYAAGLRPVGAASADFNRDGNLDIVVANAAEGFVGPSASSVSVMLGNGIGGFALFNDISIGISLKSITTGDFNGDGNPDFAITTISSSESVVSLFVGDGLGGFAAPLNTTFNGFPSSLVASDYNGDGKLDLIVTTGRFDCGTTTGSVVLLPGTGTGSFGSPLVLNTNFSSISVVPGDFNGDGKIDLAVSKACNAPSAVAVWMNNGAGGFNGPSEFVVGGKPSTIQTADINNDGKLDLMLIVQSLNAVAILTGNGDGSFAAARYFSTGYSPSFVLPGDYNRDHATDVAIANYFTSSVAVMFNACRQQRANPFDFDGDGKADVAVFRPSAGIWYLLGSTSGFSAQQFGLGTDVITPGDYDGDGRADLAVWRPDSGIWYVLLSANNSLMVQYFGQNGDVPVPNDFDADGKTDVAVFRDGIWFILQSGNGQLRVVLFGQSGDRPVPGDYDGDGPADVGVYRAGIWYVLQSSNNSTIGQQFGIGSDYPVPADYDGDGRVDLGVYRPASGGWYLLRTTSGFTGVAFGLNGDRPVAADYDGDNKADIAVFRPIDGNWYILQSSNLSVRVQPFGTNGDLPIPAAALQ